MSVSTGPITLSQVITGRVEREPDKLVFIFENGVDADERVSVADLAIHANQIAHRLRASGVEAGDRVALMMRNHPEFIYGEAAISKLGAISVPLDPRAREDALAFLLTHVGCRWAIISDEVLVEEDTAAILARAGVTPFVFATPEGRRAGIDELEAVDLREVLAGPELPDVGEVITSPDQIWSLKYTSGTTGNPKAVSVQYHRLVNHHRLPDHLGMREDDILYTGLSLHHGNAVFVTMYPSLLGATSHSVFSRQFSKSRLWDMCIKYGATNFSALGGIATALYAEPPSPRDRQHKVRWVTSAGMSAALYTAFSERFGVEIVELYGLSEAGMITVKLPGRGPAGTIGESIGECEIEVVDAHGNQLPADVEGEVVVRPIGRPLFFEYWNDPEKTQEKILNDWIRTGDLGWKDAEGWLFFSGRKEGGGIRKMGEFVAPDVVAQVLAELPAIDDVCVYGVPARSGAPGEMDIVAAIVPVDADGFDPGEVFTACAEKLRRVARPDFLQVLETLPKTVTEKVQINALRDAFGEHPENVHAPFAA